MHAEPAPSGDSPNKKRDAITRFVEAYGEIMDAARVYAAHTQGEGWQRLYQQKIQHDRKQRAKIGAILADIAESILRPDVLVTAEHLKPLGDAKKLALEHIEGMDYWRNDVVWPVKRCVEDAEECARKFLTTARQEEDRAPLHNVGLAEQMRMTIESKKVPHWNPDTGMVTIKDREPLEQGK